MIKIGVADNIDERIYRSVKEKLNDRKKYSVEKICAEKKYDVALIGWKKCKSNMIFSSDILILNGENYSETMNGSSSDIAVSYGVGERDTVALSSSMSGHEMATLRREVISVYGSVIEPGEHEIGKLPGTIEDKLALGTLYMVLELE